MSSAVVGYEQYKKLVYTKDIKSVYDFGHAELLGKGAYGKVYKARHNTFNQDYAVKTVRKKDLDADLSHQMLKELEILADVQHPNVMSVKELREDDRKYYICTEICTGGELFDRLAAHGPLSEQNAAFVAK